LEYRSPYFFLLFLRGMRETSEKTNDFWKPLLITLAVGFLYWGVLAKLGMDCWADENYSHSLLVPFVIGFFIWSEFDVLEKAAGTPSFIFGGAIVLLAILMLLAGTLGAELFTQRVSFVLMLAGVTVYFFGTKILQLLVVPIVLLLLSIPIPQIIFNRIAFPLQIWASQMAVWGIRIFDVPTVRNGNVIDILPRGAQQVISLEVVEACSGIRSLMTLVTLAVILAYFTREKRHNPDDGWFVYLKSFDFWRTVTLMIAAIPIAVLTNAARVTATGVFTYTHGKKATESTWHELSGWLVYVVALGLLILVNYAIRAGYRRFSGSTAAEGAA
jgi:exosortase